MAEICVLGLGYVGLPTASLLATSGFQVLGVDINREVVASLNAGKTVLKEVGLDAVVRQAVASGNLTASTAPEPSDTFVICVPTPTTPEHGVDLEAVKSVAKAIAPVLRRGNLVILESTSPIGTTRDVVGKILARTGMRPGADFDLCYCPERVLPGNTIHELVNNSRVVGGCTPQAALRAKAMYERFCRGSIAIADDLTAELCKLMENTYRDVNIAVANVFARIAEESGVDIWQAISLANLHPRVNILSPGPGVGGHCIPVDPWFLIEQHPQLTGLLRAAREVNDTQGPRMLARLVGTSMIPRGGKLAILGAAYKAEIDDPRESPAYLLAAAAIGAGLEVAIHDPLVEPGTYHGHDVSNDLGATLDGADAAVLVTEHSAYRTLSSRFFSRHMRGRLIGDCRNWLNHQALRLAGFTVVRLGAGEVATPALGGEIPVVAFGGVAT